MNYINYYRLLWSLSTLPLFRYVVRYPIHVVLITIHFSIRNESLGIVPHTWLREICYPILYSEDSVVNGGYNSKEQRTKATQIKAQYNFVQCWKPNQKLFSAEL